MHGGPDPTPILACVNVTLFAEWHVPLLQVTIFQILHLAHRQYVNENVTLRIGGTNLLDHPSAVIR